uniref:Protein kinase domain-containing protein n=2 Tax=Lactuca sativa TaxID=4236 RepID=A0A9R1VK27_LACSA|nr:hypothetical protein LSAT_V11C500247970 [Lactuca sativa]
MLILDFCLRDPNLKWIQRLKICLGAACGLEYLHDHKDTQQRVLHRDIKSANILLDENWNAKIADFGLSKYGPANQQHTFIFSDAKGTIGYCDPMYVETGLLTKESDVYSFGVVLFEVLCSRHCVDLRYKDERRILPMLVKKCQKQQTLHTIIDVRLRQQFDQHSFDMFVSLAYQCLERDRTHRPLMPSVVSKLKTALQYQEAFEVKAQEAKRKIIFLQNNVDQLYQEPEASLKNVVVNPLLDYEKICPPGGSNLIILYTTTVKTIPKTFQDCSSLRLILNGFKVLYQERDVSMHVDFRDELWRIMGKKVALPRLFIKGSYIGGADEVLHLHEQGKFRPLLAGIPIKKLEGPCKGCAGNLFLVCPNCSGSKKVNSGGRGLPKSCMNCNENGLIKCPICF